MTKQETNVHTFQAQPRAVRTTKRSKYRDPSKKELEKLGKNNIMFDRRVVRGNTYAAQIPTREALLQMNSPKGRKSRAKNKNAHSMLRGSTPEPVDGRVHMDVQTDNYLEELMDKPPGMESATQTDPTFDRPMAPEFKPKPSGVDKATEILSGELFDFDLEVEPILEVLVGKTLDHSLMEVLEEEELKVMERHKREFEQKRNAMLAEVQRIEAAEVRRNEEKARRHAQAKARELREQKMAEKTKARSISRKFLSGIENDVFAHLEDIGFFNDPVRLQVVEEFLPWVLKGATARLEQLRVARHLAGKILAEACAKSVQTQVEDKEKRIMEEARLAKEEAERKAKEEEERKQREEEEAKKKAEEEAAEE